MFIISSKYKRIAKLLDLKKPLVIFDAETTGLSISADRVVSLAYIKIFESGMVKKEEMIFDPQIRISPEATAVHGIRNRDVRGKPLFKEKAAEIYETFANSLYSGFNVLNFDLPILRREFLREGLDFEYNGDQVIDAKEIFHYMVPRTLASSYHYFCNKEYKGSHQALEDAEVAAEILLKQLEKFQEIRDLEFIKAVNSRGERNYVDNARKFYWRNSEAIFAFSKYKGKTLRQVVVQDPEFCQWLLEADFSEETKSIVRQAIERNGAK